MGNFLQTLRGSTNVLTRIDENLESLENRAYRLERNDTVNVGAPSSGARVLDELWVDAVWGVWRCTAAGTPGTWIQMYSGFGDTFPANPPLNYTYVHNAKGRKEHHWNGTVWTTGSTHIQSSPASVWPVNHGLGRMPTGIQVVAEDTVIGARINRIDDDNFEVRLGAALTGTVTGE